LDPALQHSVGSFATSFRDAGARTGLFPFSIVFAYRRDRYDSRFHLTACLADASAAGMLHFLEKRP
jgi:hypothetical protein